MHGVFVLFEGLPPTVIDSQVLTHVRLVRDVLGIDLSVVAVACSQAIFETSMTRLDRARAAAGGEVQLIRGWRPAMPGSLAVNRVLIGRALARLPSFSFVHARGDYSAAVAGPWGRRRGFPVLWDCRGDARAELRERFQDRAPALRAYRSRQLERELRIAGRDCAGALFVTHQLRKQMAPYLADQPTSVIPCLAPEAEFFFDAALRARVRGELAIAEDDPVYVYSGSLVAYQRFDETLAIFRAALAAQPKARLIVLTPEAGRARQLCADLPDSVICRSVGHAEVNSYLNAADFGMLIRDATPTNLVAFPTKFAEYAMTGLKIVMKEAPPACVEVARELGNYQPTEASAAPSTAVERTQCAAQATRRLGRRAAMPAYARIYEDLARAKAR
jgi:glycosyltransferase involved in cell wall biosynthesis